MQFSKFLEDEVVVVVAANHPLASAGQITPAQLQALRFVSLHRSSTVAAVHVILERSGIQWRSLAVVMVRPRCCQCETSGHACMHAMGAAHTIMSTAACRACSSAAPISLINPVWPQGQ